MLLSVPIIWLSIVFIPGRRLRILTSWLRALVLIRVLSPSSSMQLSCKLCRTRPPLLLKFRPLGEVTNRTLGYRWVTIDMSLLFEVPLIMVTVSAVWSGGNCPSEVMYLIINRGAWQPMTEIASDPTMYIFGVTDLSYVGGC